IDGSLGMSQTLGARLRAVRGKSLQARLELIVRHRFPYQAPLLRLLRAEVVAQHGQAQGPGAPHQARQRVGGACIGYQAQTAERLNETGRLRRHHDIAARQSQVRTGAGGYAIDADNDGHGQGIQAANQGRVEGLYGLTQIDGPLAFTPLPFGEILAGAKAAATAESGPTSGAKWCGYGQPGQAATRGRVAALYALPQIGGPLAFTPWPLGEILAGATAAPAAAHHQYPHVSLLGPARGVRKFTLH